MEAPLTEPRDAPVNSISSRFSRVSGSVLSDTTTLISIPSTVMLVEVTSVVRRPSISA